LNSSGVGQWKTGTSNGLSLMTGFEPVIGVGATGPIVIYDKGSGVSVRTIDVPEPDSFRLTDAAFLPSGDFSFTLTGGVVGAAYDIFRATSPGGSWSPVGTVQAGASWTDAEPPSPTAFYYAAERP
jgi:hypothetical protein